MIEKIYGALGLCMIFSLPASFVIAIWVDSPKLAMKIALTGATLCGTAIFIAKVRDEL